MKQYTAFFRMRFLAGLQYRTAAFAGCMTQMVWGLMELLMYRAFYLAAPNRMPMDMQALSNYIWIQQATLCVWIIHLWEGELFQSVLTGSVAYELLRPTSLYAMWMTRGFANRLSKMLMRMGPVLIMGCLLPAPYGLRLTISPAVFLLFLLSMALMLWLIVALGMLCYALTFYMTDYKGIITFFPAVCEILSGDLVPLPFFPKPLQVFAEISPFGSLQNVPLRIFGGDIAGNDIFRVMILQLFWCFVVTAFGWLVMECGMRRTVIAGG